MRVLVQHRSRYRYPAPALLGPQVIRLRPADHARARVESYRLDIAPEHRVHWQRDPHGNHAARVTFKSGQRIESLELLVELALDVRPVNPFDFFVDARAKTTPFTYPDALAGELAAFLDTGDPAYRLGRRTLELLAALPGEADTIDLLVEINRRVREAVAYVIRDEPGVWTPEQTLAEGRGSCRDSGVLLVALLRARGIAARFASGYLVQLADEGMIPDEPRGVDRDVVDLHAWAEAFVPGAGWIGLDGTSGLFTGEGHIPLACTASPAHAAPLDGTSDVPASAVEFTTRIARLGHEPRPTAPYTDDTWRELLAAGDRADATLVEAGLALTVGGEPTFCARDGSDAKEWQGGALGPDKWRRGRHLADELRDRLAPGGLVLHRSGKHYPGESLPRWALDVVSRADGVPLWPIRELAADSTIAAARRFGEALARELGIAVELHDAFEDDGEVAGYVLPLRRAGTSDFGLRASDWRSERWQFPGGKLVLIPGDSPIGLRLPLSSLPPAEQEPQIDADDPRQQLPLQSAVRGPKSEVHPPPIRTAVCLEPRAETLWIFLPPVDTAADFIDLIAAIDRARGSAVALEGYPPPPSPELRRFSVTPDPGVLEVNVAPVASCREAAGLHETVFEAAVACGLTAERYLLDGRAAGSGGGNHITLGGPTRETSPWLLRPELLASLVAFTQHHPSLSYLFSGLFVGPTSQAPRVDEARHDALYELELALPRLFEQPPAWQVDALLRHLLVDVAGSTHRAEISIDKLVDPQTPHGRQGLVELRAFEMPPHPRMVAAQVVLARALVASFSRAPYRHSLVRWGTELHDRFLLPYFLWRDFEEVLAHLARTGIALPHAAFEPFVELRCPLAGTLAVGDAALELRNAIEPWHVLGEEATQTGTARYVDSSVERVELRARGLDPERYAIAVNDVIVPMRAVAGRDLRVAGVRFRAWCPPHALHPHLGLHHPLHLAIVDKWAERGVAGGAYHVWHPEGRAFDTPPLTRVEAAARRAQRFTREGPPPWPLRAREVEPHPEQPYTLDLRRVDPGRPMPRAEDWPTEP
ncbi:MAG TPA: transglutaminase family protein [Kofleriaceae bacterium]